MFEKLGKLHNYWLSNPGKSALIGFLFIVFLCIFAAALGIATNFGPDGVHKGFVTSINWGPAYLIGMPLVIFSVALLFRLLNDALTSLDEILVPGDKNINRFSVVFFDYYGKAWKRYIVPASIVISIAIVLGADFTGIFAPTGYFEATIEKDWTSVGYTVYQDKPWVLFLIFNILAYFAEGIFGYICAITVLSIAYPLYLFGQCSFSDSPTTESKKSFIHNYTLQWKYDDAHGRCGLHKLDKVFITYVGIIGIAIILGLISVLKHKYTTGIDTGSVIIIVGVGLLLPLSFIWIILPYWIKFPSNLPPKDQLPEELKNANLPDPKPWPLGSEKVSWGFLAFISSGWVYLMKQGWDYIVAKYMS